MLTKVAFLSCAVAAAALPAPDTAEAGPVPLERRNHYQPLEDGSVDFPALMAMLNRTVGKYNKNMYIPTMDFNDLAKRATGKLPLTDQVTTGEDELYYGPATVGGTRFTIDYDTGSSDLFVPGPTCGMQQGCHGPQYDNSGVNRHKKTSVTYGSGQVAGNDYLDTVCVAGLCANKQNLISLTNAQGFSTSKSGGLMGMGFKSIAASKSNPFFQSLINQGKVTAKEFSFYLGRARSHTQGQSEMFLGGRNPKKFTGTPTTIAVSTPGYWQIPLDGVKVGGTTAPGSQGQAAIDTGTTIVLGPTSAVTAIFALIPGSAPLPLLSGSPTITLFTYPCNTPDIPVITFGGKDFAINPLDFSLGSLTGLYKDPSVDAAGPLGGLGGILGGGKGNKKGGGGGILGGLPLGQCVAALGAADLNPGEALYVVGDSFLKNWYSIFSYDGANGKPSVSFATAKGNNNAGPK